MASLSTTELTLGLRALFPSATRVEVAGRTATSRASSFSAEVVRCRVDADELRLFCKFGEPDLREPGSHRRGLAYESFVYESVLVWHRPRHLGWFTVGRAECLVLEYLDGARSLRVCGFDDYVRAARWLGRFHRRHTDLRANGLTVYGPDMFERWIDRLVGHRDAPDVPWVIDAAHRLSRLLPPLADAPMTLLHGEYFPGNIMLAGADVRPVDWETAGFGAGLLDLAALTWGWHAPYCRELVRAYDEERTGCREVGTPADRLIAARALVVAQSLAETRTWRTSGASHALEYLLHLLGRVGPY